MAKTYNADWWKSEHDSSWSKVKEAFRRDWEQTKHQFGGKAPDLNQGVSDTVKQAVGKESIPPGNTPNFDDYEPAFRFGHGARVQYGDKYPSWNAELESGLRKDWSSTSDDAEWTRNRDAIQRAYDFKAAEHSR